MKKIILFTTILILVGLVLIGGGCGSGIDWPDFCQEEVKVPEAIDESLIFPDSRCVRVEENYMGLSNTWDFSFCAKAQKEAVLEWYKQELAQKGYEYWYDEEYAKDEYLWKKGEAYIIVNLPYIQSDEFIRFMLTIHQ